MRSPAAVVLALAVLLPSCSGEYGNPFANDNPTLAPSADADLVYVSNAWSVRPDAGREVFAVEDSGASATRLTFCDSDERPCDVVEVAPGPDRRRVAVRRVEDTDGNGRLTDEDGQSLVMIDLSRGVEGLLLAANARVSGMDWYPGEELLFYSAGGLGTEDLYQVATNGQNNQNLTSSAAARERRPRFNFNATSVTFERIDGEAPGSVWAALGGGLRPVTTPAADGAPLAGTPYRVGADADPAFSPDSREIVFRRLASGGGDGAWDVYAVLPDGTGLREVAAGGGLYRGAPDWGAGGIAFTEREPGGQTRLVVVDPAGANRRVLLTVGAGFQLDYPRWLE